MNIHHDIFYDKVIISKKNVFFYVKFKFYFCYIFFLFVLNLMLLLCLSVKLQISIFQSYQDGLFH